MDVAPDEFDRRDQDTLSPPWTREGGGRLAVIPANMIVRRIKKRQDMYELTQFNYEGSNLRKFD